MKKLRFNSIVIDHARQPKQYHTRLIVFLLAVILLCLLIIALRGEMSVVQSTTIIIKPKSAKYPILEVQKQAAPILNIHQITAQMMVESNGDHGAISSKGCVGSMQVMPATAAEYGIEEWTLQHPVLGLDAGIRIMQNLWDRWKMIRDLELRWAMTLASYNCGHWRAQQFFYGMILRKCGVRWSRFRFLPRETLNYIQKIKTTYRGAK